MTTRPHMSRRFSRRRFNKKITYMEGRFDRLTEHSVEPMAFFEEEEWHDMRMQAGVIPSETFGKLGKDGLWREQALTTSGRMLDWLSPRVKSTGTSLLRWLNDVHSKSRWRSGSS